MFDGKNWATSYALTAEDLYRYHNLENKLDTKVEDYPEGLQTNLRYLYGLIFRYFMHLVIDDIIKNLVTFKGPVARTYIEMIPISGEDFKRARLNGAFEDIDFLVSNFTGYNLVLRINNRYTNWKKRIYVSKPFKNLITELTNKGVGW